MFKREETVSKVIASACLCLLFASANPTVADYGLDGYWSPRTDQTDRVQPDAERSRAEQRYTEQTYEEPMYSPTPRRPSVPDFSVRPIEPRRSPRNEIRPAQTSIPMARPMLAVDIDETLSITDYKSLIWGIGKDDSTPLPGAQATLSRLAVSFDVIYVTARSRSLKDETEAWLSRHGFPSGKIVTSPTLGDFIFQGDFKRKVMEKLRRENPNMVVGIGDKAKDGQAYRSSGMVSVIVNPWRKHKYHTDDIVLRDWSAVSDFFESNHEVLSNPGLLQEQIGRGRLSLNLSSEAQEYRRQS